MIALPELSRQELRRSEAGNAASHISMSDWLVRASLPFLRYSRRHGFMQHWTNDHRDWYRNVYLKSEHWRALRGRKLAANPCCEKCGSDSDLDVHHLQYRKLFDVALSDLLTVCRTCHEAIHAQEGMPVRERPNFNKLSRKQRKKIAIHNARIAAAKARKPLTSEERLKRHRRMFQKCSREQWEKTRR